MGFKVIKPLKKLILRIDSTEPMYTVLAEPWLMNVQLDIGASSANLKVWCSHFLDDNLK